MHLARAAAVFWVGAVLLPGAVAEAGAVRQPTSSEDAFHGVSGSAAAGLDRVGALSAKVAGAEDDVDRIVARLQLETRLFIANLP